MTRLRLALIISAMFTLAACGGSTPVEPTVSLSEAQATAVKAVQAAAAAIFPAGYKLTDQGPQPLHCTDSVDKPTGQVQMGVSFWVDGPDRAQNNTYYENLKKWWSENGWHLQTDKRPQDLFANAYRQDGYVMSLEGTVTGAVIGRLSIGAGTPCVWPHGTPDPAAS